MAKNLVLASCTFSILPQVAGGTNEDGNNSTLRRKLFAGLDDDDDGSDLEKDQRDSSGWSTHILGQQKIPVKVKIAAPRFSRELSSVFF